MKVGHVDKGGLLCCGLWWGEGKVGIKAAKIHKYTPRKKKNFLLGWVSSVRLPIN